MREIKFRGQDFETGEWIYGSYNGVNAGVADVFIIYEKEILDPVSLGFIDTEIVEKEVKEETVGQYTGLKDRHGVEIYEGDVVARIYRQKKPDGTFYPTDRIGASPANRKIVEFTHTTKMLGYNVVSGDSLLVIGNIYENPELLEVGE